jgi:hypothetical protein
MPAWEWLRWSFAPHPLSVSSTALVISTPLTPADARQETRLIPALSHFSLYFRPLRADISRWLPPAAP